MDKTIIVSMYNKDHSIIKTIDQMFFPSLIRNASANIELIILNDCSPLEKETQAMLDKYLPDLQNKFGKVRIVKNYTNLGFAKSYNKGISMAIGQQILIVNDDVYFTKGSIARLFQVLNESPDYLIVGPITNAGSVWSYQYCKQAPKLKDYSSTQFAKLEKFADWLKIRMNGKKINTDNLCGFCFVSHAKLLKEMGGFNESYKFGGYEDTDFIQKVVANYGQEKIIMALGIFIGHGGKDGTSRSFLQHPIKMMFNLTLNSFRYGKNWGYIKLIKRIAYGIFSQKTGKGTISDLFS